MRGERGKEAEGQRQIASSSRKARAHLPAEAFAHGSTRAATCVGSLWATERDGHFQKVVLGLHNKRYLLMLVIFEGACPSPMTKKKKSWGTNLEYTANL